MLVNNNYSWGLVEIPTLPLGKNPKPSPKNYHFAAELSSKAVILYWFNSRRHQIFNHQLPKC